MLVRISEKISEKTSENTLASHYDHGFGLTYIFVTSIHLSIYHPIHIYNLHFNLLGAGAPLILHSAAIPPLVEMLSKHAFHLSIKFLLLFLIHLSLHLAVVLKCKL